MHSAGKRIIAVMNQKGGVGKTTTTVNLGAALAEAGSRVCLIDLDPQSHLSLHLGIDTASASNGDDQGESRQHTVYDLLIDPACEASQCVVHARENLDVIPAEVDLAAAETELASHPDRQRILSGKMAQLREGFVYDLHLKN